MHTKWVSSSGVICVIQFQSFDFILYSLESATFPIFRTISDVTNRGLYSQRRFRPLRDFKDRTILSASLTWIARHTYLRLFNFQEGCFIVSLFV